jgi:hypothetical protein
VPAQARTAHAWPGPERENLTLTVARANRTIGEPAAPSTAPGASARHARGRRPPADVGHGGETALRRRGRKALLIAGAVAVAAVGGVSAFLSVHTTPSAAPRPAPVQRLSAEAIALRGRVGDSKYFTGCDATAQAVTGAEATINCQARQPGITVSASSFKVTGRDSPFSPFLIASESDGLNKFLKSTIPNSLPVVPGNIVVCGPNGGTTCPVVGFSGYWGSPTLVLGRLYCYEQSGSTYYVAWTFDNDSYEASYNEDFVVVASSLNLVALVNWWNQTPV